jgi:ATP-binding cassette subfamily B protein
MAKKLRKISFRKNLGMYFKLAKKYWYYLALLVVLSILAEGSLTVERFLFKIVVDNGTEYAAGVLLREPFVEILIIVGMIFASIMIVRAVSKWLFIHVLIRLDCRMIVDLKRKFFNHLVHLSHRFHAGHKSGTLISRLIRGARAIEEIGDILFFNMTSMVIQTVLVGGSLLYFSASTAVVVGITAVLFIAYSVMILTLQQSAKLKHNESEDTEKGIISDVFTNIDSIKYFGKEDLIKAKYAKYAEKTKLAAKRNWGFFRFFDGGQALILAVGVFLLVFIPLTQFLDGDLTIGTLVFIYTIYGNLVGTMFGFVWGIRGFYTAMADFEDLFEYDAIKNDIQDIPNAKKLKVRRGDIVFDNVTFKYHKRGLFKNFNLKIKKNQKIALVGPSGCGKTSLIKLLYRLYDIDSGRILIDGKNIKNFQQESLRSELSIVPQECVLFDDTIYNNIKFSNPRAIREEVTKAMKFAQLYNIVSEFPQKEKTIVGERGVKLSGGEKQRVSIARAILADRKVIVLDEATSALDSRIEHEIQQGLENLLKNRTAIIIAHRLSTIMKADKIVVMDKGRIVQMGRHKDLIRRKGLYQDLWNMQKGGYIK